MFGNNMYVRALAPTLSDTVDQPEGVAQGIYVGGAGNIVVSTSAGQTVTFTAPTIGTILPVMIRRVLATGTTATGLLLLY